MRGIVVVGYTADAECWCPGCAIERYGPAIETETVLDSEGNAVHPIFAYDDIPDYWTCYGCAEAL